MSPTPSLTPPLTLARVGTVLHASGMVTEAELRGTLAAAAGYADEPLNPYGTARALEEFGAAVSVHGDDIDSLGEGYAELLARAARVAGGSVAITGVRLVRGEAGFADGRADVVEFDRDGVRVSVPAEHFADDYLDHIAACEAVARTVHRDDPRTWRSVDFPRDPHATYDSIMVLATPDQAESLRARLGLRIG
ncbi:hypothetical protein OG233_12230 [Streptomyces sp. NBC_01218]|uniref:hypothetical protein n=1 Tax=Streptomyces sp. NBC_01218 TaxID=2903780 RepID=UPI002E15BB2A|nr:hypothetical protein OG233_12230 [Streptomyces sp. NBC_01218]